MTQKYEFVTNNAPHRLFLWSELELPDFILLQETMQFALRQK